MLNWDVLDYSSSQVIVTSIMGRKKYNLCSKCEFRHAAPTGKACTAGAGVQDMKKPVEDDKTTRRGQGPNRVGLDALDDAPHRQNAVDERVEKIEQDMGAMNGKLDLIIASMQKPGLPESEGDEIVESGRKMRRRPGMKSS